MVGFFFLHLYFGLIGSLKRGLLILNMLFKYLTTIHKEKVDSLITPKYNLGKVQ